MLVAIEAEQPPPGGIIMHGMNNFGLISRMITDWAYPAGAIHRRLETRWVSR